MLGARSFSHLLVWWLTLTGNKNLAEAALYNNLLDHEKLSGCWLPHFSFLVNGEATAIEAKVNARKLLCLNESDLLEKVSHFLKPIPNEIYSITLKNQSGDEFVSQQIETNKFGVFSGNIGLRASYPLGNYTLNVEKVDGTVLAAHELSIEDFVPLTIEPKLSVANEIWKLDQPENITLKAEYFSGGPAAGLDAELIFKLKPQREHFSDKLKGYIFGQSKFNNEYDPVPLRESLSSSGSMDATIDNKFNLLSRNLFNVSLEGTVFDVGGRPNKTRLTVPLDTETTYVGLQPAFENRVDQGSVAPVSYTHLTLPTKA